MHELTRCKPGSVSSGVAAGVLLPGAGGGVRALPTLGSVRVDSSGVGRWLGLAGGVDLTAMGPFEAIEAAALAGGAGGLPGTGWVGFLGYGAGAWAEPTAGIGRGDDLPLGELHRVELGSGSVVDAGRGVSGWGFGSVQGREGYVAAVRRAKAYIGAGDIYQANIAHQIRGRVSGAPAGLYGALAGGARPRHGVGVVGGSLEDGSGYAVLSVSPELFLSFDARTRRLTTRPMKGTRPGGGDAAELRDAEKDRAELAMIVDLMRNDLGRVCEFGSVRVDAQREIERHGAGAGAVLQATATVSGVVREGVGLAAILSATFPPGSVTGTPKVRAMQVIDELEPFERGPYCGCVGTIADDGSFELAVAIRTAVVRGVMEGCAFVDAGLTYCVGAGIVADSDPESEWEETLTKAGVLPAAWR